MKRVLYFATKLDSRDIQKCDCLWVPFVVCVFPGPTATGFHSWETRSRLSPSQWLLGGSVTKSNLHSTVLSEPKFGPPPTSMKNSWISPCKDVTLSSEPIKAYAGVCKWIIFFSSYIRAHLWDEKQYYLIYVRCNMKIVLIMCILEEQETYLLRAVSNHSVSCGSAVPSPLKANNREWALRKPMN